jgi:hypothetical protein
MSQKLSNFLMKKHYHIRWSDEKLDWEPFNTRAEAEASAKDLVLGQETYTIQESDQSCTRCLKAKSANHPA